MASKKSKLEMIKEDTLLHLDGVNKKIEALGYYTNALYTELSVIQAVFAMIRNMPKEQVLQYRELKEIRLNWKNQVDKIKKDYDEATLKQAGAGMAGAGLGVAVAALGPTAAMGIATTFGVASTGTAIAALHGVAATNAALAWLGGGALAVGGGGMAAGEALLALAGPIGWGIGGIALLSSGLALLATSKNKKTIEDIFVHIGERDINSYKLAIVELNERIDRIIDETDKLHEAVDQIIVFGADYNKMTEAQQYTLGAYVNLMNSSTQLLTNPILGLQPKYTEDDFKRFIESRKEDKNYKKYKVFDNVIIALANLLYKIDLTENEKKLLWKTFRKNEEMLDSLKISKKEFDYDVFEGVINALEYTSKPER